MRLLLDLLQYNERLVGYMRKGRGARNGAPRPETTRPSLSKRLAT